MKIRLTASILLCCCYLVSSSSLSHAFAMEHMGFHEQPAEESCGCVDHTSYHTKNTSSHDCLERCLGPYKDFSGISQYTLRETCSFSYYDFVVHILGFPEKHIYQFHCLDDPPDLVGFGDAVIGKEIKKVE